MEILINISGWAGTVLIVIAYYLVSANKIPVTDKNYQWLNLVGSVLLGVNVLYRQAWPAFALEVVWGVIAIMALAKLRMKN